MASQFPTRSSAPQAAGAPAAPPGGSIGAAQGGTTDETTRAFFGHSRAPRLNTDAYIAATIKKQYPQLELLVAPQVTSNLLAYAAAGHANYQVIEDKDIGVDIDADAHHPGLDDSSASKALLPSSLRWKLYVPPARRLDGDHGALAESVFFGKFLYQWRGYDFVVYLVDGRDGVMSYPVVSNYYILTTERARADALILAAGQWGSELHEEVWVFDGGNWQKSKELYDNTRNATWDAVILDPALKKAIVDDHLAFFGSRATYSRLRVPWKRGIIYYGPPGNGKSISVKAMMHTLYSLKNPIPTLYVRTLASFMGPEYSLRLIFEKARQFAPCYLVFEDLDTIVSDNVRSYFLNEVDGLTNNDGIFMVGSTNHLDRLDPGISKRPSRFDRKYYFPDPNLEERTAYCHFWQSKLADNKDVEFPDELCTAIAEITEKFSFAYMQEAFVAALLAIARRSPGSGDSEGLTDEMDDGWVGVLGSSHGDLEELILWVEIKKQIKILRDGMEEEK